MTTTNCMLFLAGAGCGAAAAVLLAPKSGAEFRKQIAGKAACGQRAVKETVNETVDEFRDAVNRRAEVVDHTVKEGVAAFKEAREVFMNA